MDSSDQLVLQGDLNRRVGQTICANIRAAVDGSSTRDQNCLDYDDQLYMRMTPLQVTRWRNSCELNAPLTWELAVTLHAMIMQAARRDPKVMVESHDPDKDESAKKLEDYLNSLSQKYRLNRVLEDVAWNAIRDDVSILHVGWGQHYGLQQKTMYRAKGQKNAFPIDPEDRRPGEVYEEVHHLEPITERVGCDFRAVELTDFYLYPASAANIQEWEPRGAIGCGERIHLSEQMLIDGIEDYGYDIDEVETLLRMGPTDFAGFAGSDKQDRIDAFNGVDGVGYGPQDGYWECFVWYQRIPKMRDGNFEAEVDEVYRWRDAMFVCCPQHNILLKMSISPYAQRPYIPFYIKPRPNSFLGSGLCQMVMQLQEEDTTSLRQDIDIRDLQASGLYVCSTEQFDDLKRLPALGPGMFVPEDVPNSIRPLPIPTPLPFAQRSEYTRSRAQGMVTAQGYGQMPDKVRKAAEVQATVGAADSKFELFLSNWQEGLSDMFAWMAALHADFGGQDATFKDSMGNSATITQADMEGEYSFVPAATSTTANQEARFKLAQAKAGEQTRYMGLIAQSPPQYWNMLWHASREILIDLGTRRPEQYIGPEPPPPPPVEPAVQTMIQTLTQMGVDPKIIQTALMNVQQQQTMGLQMANAAQNVLTPMAPPGGVA